MKTFTQIFTMLLLVSSLSAQMAVGVKTGIAINKYSFSDAINDAWDSPATLGYTAGVSLDIAFGGRMGLETGLFWTRKGSGMESEMAQYTLTSNNENISVYVDSKEKLNYVTIPLLLKYQFRGKTVGSYVMAGPELNFAISGKYSANFVDKNGSVIQNAEQVLNANGVESTGDIEFGSGANDLYKSFDFGISIGGGLFYELEMGKITLDARYFLGMSNLVNTEDDDIKLKNRNLIVQLGYSIPLSGGW